MLFREVRITEICQHYLDKGRMNPCKETSGNVSINSTLVMSSLNMSLCGQIFL